MFYKDERSTKMNFRMPQSFATVAVDSLVKSNLAGGR